MKKETIGIILCIIFVLSFFAYHIHTQSNSQKKFMDKCNETYGAGEWELNFTDGHLYNAVDCKQKINYTEVIKNG